MVNDTYTIGSGTPPDWLKDKLLPYKRMNGTVGYEFRGVYRTFYLVAGDRLVLRNDRKIDVRRNRDDR